MTNNVTDFAAYRATKAAMSDAPTKVLAAETGIVVSIAEWKAQGHKRKSAAIVSTTDVLGFGGYAA